MIDNEVASLKNVLAWLVAAGVILIVLALLLSLSGTPLEPDKLKLEWIRSLIQMAVVVLGGAALKSALDEGHARRRYNESLVEFRQDRLKRLVASNNRVRQARYLLRAYGSAKSYRDLFLELLAAASELRSIKHEIDSLDESAKKNNFSNWKMSALALEKMYHYLENLSGEFIEHYKELSEMQREAENPTTHPSKREEFINTIRSALENLKGVNGLIDSDDKKSDFETNYNSKYSIVLQSFMPRV